MSQFAGIFDRFLAHAVADPERPVCVLGDGTVWGYGQLSEVAARCAAALVAAGVVSGDRVAVQVDKSPEALALYLATQQLGAVILPLNTAYTAHEIEYFVSDAEPTVVVCRPADNERVRGVCPPQVTVLTLGEAGEGSLLVGDARCTDVWEGAGDALAAILYTSGTTGRSKGAMITRQNLMSNCEALCTAWEFTAADRLIHALPIFHIHGLFVAANLVLATGASMHFLPTFDADRVLELFSDATVLMGVPTFYTRLNQHPGVTPEVCAPMRLFVAGSAPLLASDHQQFHELTGHAIVERYGMTETGINTSNPLHGERRAGTVGMPLPGVRVRVGDRLTGAPLGIGETGVLQVQGPNVFAGYWNMPEKTAAEFTTDGFFVTGDLAVIAPDGYVSIVGRDKDLVISGGYNIYPKEIEEVIDAFPGVVETAVIGVPHPDLGEVAVAVVVLEPTADPDTAALRSFASERLARFKQPRDIRVVTELPRNTMGKVQKAQLRAEHAALFSGAQTPHAQPR